MRSLILVVILAICGLREQVDAQGFGKRPTSGYEGDAVILKQDFNLNPDGSYNYK